MVNWDKLLILGFRQGSAKAAIGTFIGAMLCLGILIENPYNYEPETYNIFVFLFIVLFVSFIVNWILMVKLSKKLEAE